MMVVLTADAGLSRNRAPAVLAHHVPPGDGHDLCPRGTVDEQVDCLAQRTQVRFVRVEQEEPTGTVPVGGAQYINHDVGERRSTQVRDTRELSAARGRISALPRSAGEQPTSSSRS